MRGRLILLGLVAALVGPAAAEEETIPSATFQEVYEGWKDMIGGRVVVTGGFVAQAGKGPDYAIITDGTSAVIDIDTSKAINPETVKALEAACNGFFTTDIPDCRVDVVGTVEKNPNMDFPVLTQPNFVKP